MDMISKVGLGIVFTLFVAYIAALVFEDEQKNKFYSRLYYKWISMSAWLRCLSLAAFIAVASVFNYIPEQPQLSSGYSPAYPPHRIYVPPPAAPLYTPSNTNLTVNQFKAGFAHTRTVTNTAPWLVLPTNTVAHKRWTHIGVSKDTFYLPLTNWFPLATSHWSLATANPVQGLHISSSGTISFAQPFISSLPQPTPSNRPLNYLAPLQTTLGIVPPESRVWHAVTPSNTLLLTWQNVYYQRDTNYPISFQTELHPRGDFTYRYDLSQLPIPDAMEGRDGSPQPSAAVSERPALPTTNFVIGAQFNGGGETYTLGNTNAVVDGLELHWTWFGQLDPNLVDHDNDGISTWDELFVYGTAPRMADSDLDGLSDYDELFVHGTDPLKEVSFDDGTNDFWRVHTPASLDYFPWMELEEGDEDHALLTVATRLDSGNTPMALVVGTNIIPVATTTTAVSRVAIPLDKEFSAILIPPPGNTASIAYAEVLKTTAAGYIDDSEGIFTLPPDPEGQGVNYAPMALPDVIVKETKISEGLVIKSVLEPALLCPHTGKDTLRHSLSAPLHSGHKVAKVGLLKQGEVYNKITVLNETLELMFTNLVNAAPGFYTVDYPVAIRCERQTGTNPIPDAEFKIPAHYCKFKEVEEYLGGAGSSSECPCCPDEICPCNCESVAECECQFCSDPWYVDAPTNGVGELLGVTGRSHKLLLVDSDPDSVAAWAKKHPGQGATPTNTACTFCGCIWEEPAGGSGAFTIPATIYRRTANLAATPGSITTNSGVFKVRAVAASPTMEGDVFTWQSGASYSRGRYTAVGLKSWFAGSSDEFLPQLQLGHTNSLLIKTQFPTNSNGSISFEGSALVDTVLVSNRLNATWNTLQPSYAASLWRGTYLDTNQVATLRYVANATGERQLKLAYSQPESEPAMVSTNFNYNVIRIHSEPITSETDTEGHVYNTSGLPVGDTARYKVSIPEGVLDTEKIKWRIIEGANNIAFIKGVDTGTEIAITANSTGNYKLEVDIEGFVVTAPHEKPYFTGEVFAAVNVPTTVFIVRDQDGANPARDPNEIPGLLTDANKILWQRGYSLVQNGVTRYLDNDDWLEHTDILNPANVNLNAMFNSTNSAGKAVELYFVNQLDNGMAEGLHTYKGMAIAKSAQGNVIAHEVLHSAGLADIYTAENPLNPELPNLIQGDVSMERIPLDFGGGYYRLALPQQELIGRLIMRSSGTASDLPLSHRVFLPRGEVYGWKHITEGDGSSSKIKGHAKVGQSSITSNPRSF